MGNEYKFPKNFLWGSASSGPQSEGAAFKDGKSETIWDYWYKKNPDRFYDLVGPTDTSTFYENYFDDIQLLKETGHNSFRTSIQWARLIPNKNGKVNQKAFEFYDNLIDTLIANEILPIINLFHFDMPMWAQEIGGWENRDVIDYYVRYAKTCFELFGNKVKYWTTFNEPIVPVEGGYLYDFHYPCVCDGKKAVQVAYHTALANALAVKEFKKLHFKNNSKIGIILCLSPSYPKSDNKEDIEAAKYNSLFFNKSFLDPAIFGRYPKELIDIIKKENVLPIYDSKDINEIKHNTIDFLGVNYYQPVRIQAQSIDYKSDVFMPDKYFKVYQDPNAKMNIYRGWEIYEKGIYDICIDIKEHYNNIPFYISENGMGVEGEQRFINDEGVIEDDYRIQFVSDHLKYLHKSICEGANCFGYHMWTFIDNWSWTNAYKNRYGFVSLDLKTQKRTIKKSGKWFKKLSTTNILVV